MFQGHADPRPTEQEVTEALTNPEREEGPSPTRVGYFNVVGGPRAADRSSWPGWITRTDGTPCTATTPAAEPRGDRRMAETKTKGTRFGPEDWQFDPYDGMTQEEIDHEVDRFLESQKTVPVSLRLPRWVIEQAKSEASRRGIPTSGC